MQNSRKRIRRSIVTKPLGRPTYNPSYVLTPKQISFIVAILITDGWLGLGKGNKNPSIGLQLAKRSEILINLFVETLKDIVTAKPLSRMRTARSSGDKLFEQLQIRTVAHPQIHQFIEAFGGHGRNKTVPSVSYLMQVLTWQSLAVVFMCDASRKGAKGRAMELHLQGYSGYKPLGRLCKVLYQKFGIKAYTTYYGKSLGGEDQYHIQVSGYSLPIIRKKLLPHMLPEFHYKVPVPGPIQRVDAYNSPWRQWYKANKDATWMEDIFKT